MPEQRLSLTHPGSVHKPARRLKGRVSSSVDEVDAGNGCEVVSQLGGQTVHDHHPPAGPACARKLRFERARHRGSGSFVSTEVVADP